MKFLIILALLALASAKVSFRGDQVLTLHPKTPSHLRLIKEFGSFDGFADFWHPDSAEAAQIGHPVDVRFKSRNLRVVKKKLEKALMQYEVKIDDLQHLIDHQFNRARDVTKAYDYNEYHTYNEVNQWTKDMAAQYPNLARRETLITSEEGREIPKLTLGVSTDKPILLIDCGIHAREWISPAFCQCYVNRMLNGYGIDFEITAMMDQLTIIVLPVLNVDGYAYTWTNDRMWRKTRSNYGTACTGVDPNRNFDAGWSGPGASSNPCSETYYGPEVHSEQLSKGLYNLVTSNDGNIEAYITFHSYAQVFIYPYSYAEKDVDNFYEHDNLAGDAAAAIQAVHGKRYTYGSGWKTFYLAAGGSDDFAKDYHVPISYTIELRDTGRYGFVLPADQIQPTCEETYAAVDVIAEHIMTKL